MVFIVPEAIGFSSAIPNPALPPRRAARLPPRLRPVSKSITSTNGIGPRRVYLDFQTTESEKSHPLRPVTGSVADLDIIMKNCDFSTNQVTTVPPSGHGRLASVFLCSLLADTFFFLVLVRAGLSGGASVGCGTGQRAAVEKSRHVGLEVHLRRERKGELHGCAAHETLPFVPDRAGSGPERWTCEETRCAMGKELHAASRSTIQIVPGLTRGTLRRKPSSNLPHVLDWAFHRQTVFGVAFLLVYAEPGPPPSTRST